MHWRVGVTVFKLTRSRKFAMAWPYSHHSTPYFHDDELDLPEHAIDGMERAPWKEVGKSTETAPGRQWIRGTPGIGTSAQLLNSPMMGPLMETFVVNELRKLAGWSKTQVQLYHYRTEAGREVDIVLEDAKGRIVGIEVKSSMAVGNSDMAGLKDLREAAGDKWIRGILLHPGLGITPFAKDIHAVPMSSLWEW